MNNIKDTIISFVITIILLLSSCKLLGFCVCFSQKDYIYLNESFTHQKNRMHFNNPMVRVSRIGTKTHNYPYNVNFRVQKNVI